MPGLQVIKTTKTLWGISAYVPAVLCSPSEFNQARQGKQSRANVSGHREGKRVAYSRSNPYGAKSK